MSINFSAKTPNYSASQSSKNKTVTGTPTASPTGTPTCTCGVTGTPTPTVDPTATPTSSVNPTETPGADDKSWNDYRKDFENAFYGNPQTEEEKQERMSQPQSGPFGTNHMGCVGGSILWATYCVCRDKLTR